MGTNLGYAHLVASKREALTDSPVLAGAAAFVKRRTDLQESLAMRVHRNAVVVLARHVAFGAGTSKKQGVLDATVVT
jgi:hypothetical protein